MGQIYSFPSSSGISENDSLNEASPSEAAALQVESSVSSKTGFLTRFACDLSAAGIASFFVAPFITIVDKSIISNASGREKLLDCMKSTAKEALFSPLKFVRKSEFLWVYFLYTSTYTTANMSESVCSIQEISPLMPKFVATTVVNTTVCVSKDRAFTKMFGTIAPKKVSPLTLGLFTTRDMMTVFCSFSLPEPTSVMLMKASKGELKHTQALDIAQIALPLAVQFFSTPLHLTGLDIYNRPDAQPKERLAFLRREYLKSTLARLGRIGPAFGLGGVVNRKLVFGLRQRYIIE